MRRQGSVGFALMLVTLATIITALGIFWNAPASVQSAVAAYLRPLIVVAVVAGGAIRINLGDVFFRDPRSRYLLAPFLALAAVAAAEVGILLSSKSRALVTSIFPLLVAVHTVMGLIAVSARVPAIDVYVVQKYACTALAHGHNPYAITFPNVYGPNTTYYPPGMVVDGQVQSGYDYPPLSLLLDMPGFLLGDLRYSYVVAVALSVLMIGYMRPNGGGVAPAVILMFSPRIFYQLQVAWLEPMVLLMLVATVFFAMRKRYALAASALGLFFVSKQYTLLALPAVFVLIPRPWRWRDVLRWGVIAAAAGGFVTLPFVLRNPAAFYHSMTALFIGILRQDAISYLPLLAKWLNLSPSLAYAATAAVPPAMLTLWRAPRTPAGFAVSVALILMCAFLFSTQSFGNYYFLLIGTVCTAIAAGITEPSMPAALVESPSSPDEGQQ